ncbi:MAG TPA: glycosyltransferase family 2 protein [Mycobacteriales bacterium]|jgi:glycosyltransferase involved in cell wall biosynthesis|nr:glycosyltransferase family 2 protein [Mycobacteriales bacterium]
MSIDVSVVVPVYNPGKYIETCIDGYLSQTMPADRREIIFVDDGSTDETPERLDRLAAEHPDVQVIHQPNSGWPGKPRNVGIETARGDYVFFHDHDDYLSPKALERMVAMARRTRADLLIPKMVGHKRRAPHTLFRNNIDRAVLGQDRLMTSLTPHKMLRRQFLNDARLRFPEGKRRLEDHVFVVEAFLAADVISVLSDYPCYHRVRRDDEGNAAFEKWDAKYYYQYVEEVIDVIEAHTEPGELRDTLLKRPYAGEMLSRLAGKRINRWTDESRQAIFDEVRRIALERFPADFHTRLAIVPRAHAQAIVTDRMDQLIAVAASSAAPIARAELRDLSWSGTGWVAEVSAEILHADGSPIRLIAVDGGWRVDPRLIPPDLDAGPYSTHQVRGGSVDVTVRNRMNDVEWYVEAAVESSFVKIEGDPDGASRIVFQGTVPIDPTTAGGGRPLGVGGWDVALRLEAFGVSRAAMPKAAAGARPVLSPRALVLPVRRIATTRLLAKGNKHLIVNVVPMEASWRGKLTVALRTPRDVIVTSAGDLVVTIKAEIPKLGQPTDYRVVLIAGGAVARQRSAELAPPVIGAMLASRTAGGKAAAPPSALDRAGGGLQRLERVSKRGVRRLARRLGLQRKPKKR